MDKRSSRPGSIVLSWLGVLVVVFGSLSWLPAAAQDATPGSDPVVVATQALQPETPEPTVPPVTAPPASAPPDPPTQAIVTEDATTEPPAARQDLITTQASPRVTGIVLTCAVAGTIIDGVATVSDPQASTIVLQLITMVGSASLSLDDANLDLTPGKTDYAFQVELEANDYATSTSKQVAVSGPDGTPVSEPIAIAQGPGGGTVCIPPGSTSPTEPSATVPVGTGTPTPTATAPAGTSTPTPSPSPEATTTTTPATSTVGKVSNTGGSNLRCRAQPTTSAAIITQIPAGATIEVRGPVASGWAPVRCANQDGWVSADYLVITAAPAPTATPVATATATTTPAPGTATFATVSNTGGQNLRCRTAPDTSASIITLLPSGMRVEVRGAAVNGWLPVRCGGQDGWVSAGYVVLSSGSATPTATVTPTPAKTPAPGGTSTATVSGTGGAGLRCRTAPVSGAVLTVLPELARIEVVGSQQNGWIQVRCAGQTGWVSVAYLLFNVGSGTGSGEIWMDINLSSQSMVVYQGDKVLARTLVSTGRPGFDTPTGTYYINRKVPVKDMTGTLGGEYYYVHDVPSVMYFTNRGHAIHGAYWHNNFGYRMSHGCVNLPVNFASWLYSITPMGARVRIRY